MSAGFQMAGFRELEGKLALVGRVTAKRILDATGKKALRPMAEEAQRLVHVSGVSPAVSPDLGPPHLRDMIVPTVAKPEGNATSTTGLKIRKGSGKAVRDLARANRLMRKLGASKKTRKLMGLFAKNPRRYWHLVEFGTSRTKKYPFIRPAADRTVGRVLTIYSSELKKKIDDAFRGSAP